MKIILLKDTKKLGQKYAVVDVAPGYGTFLINSGAAEMATPAKIKALEKKAAASQAEKEAKNADIEAAVEKLASEPLRITAKANEKGHLFEGITAQKLIETFQAKTGIELPETVLELEAPIKEVGEHKVGVNTDTWEGTLHIKVEPEE